MFRNKDEVKPISLDSVPNVSPEVLKLVENADPVVLAKAMQDIAKAQRLDAIEAEINVIGKQRTKLHKRATELTHEREELLGQKLSAVAACAE